MSNSSRGVRRGLAVVDNPLDMLVPQSTEVGGVDRNEKNPTPPAPASAPTEPESTILKEESASYAEQPAAARATTKTATRAQAKSTKAGGRATRSAGVSASSAYRIGTVQDPYHRSDGEVVRPLRLTLPINLIANIQVLAARRGRTPRSLIQQLLEQHVREHQDEL